MQARKTPPFGLRMPEALKEQIKREAARDGRSMNAQIVQHLRSIYPCDDEQEASE